MKTNQFSKKLSLHKKTITVLTDPLLDDVRGGVTVYDTVCRTCPTMAPVCTFRIPCIR